MVWRTGSVFRNQAGDQDKCSTQFSGFSEVTGNQRAAQRQKIPVKSLTEVAIRFYRKVIATKTNLKQIWGQSDLPEVQSTEWLMKSEVIFEVPRKLSQTNDKAVKHRNTLLFTFKSGLYKLHFSVAKVKLLQKFSCLKVFFSLVLNIQFFLHKKLEN